MLRTCRRSLWTSFALCCGLFGCGGESNQNLLARYGDRVKQRRESLTKLAALLPQPGTFAANEKCASFNPPLTARNGSVGLLTPGNCDWILVEELTKPLAYQVESLQFDMFFQSALIDAIALADPESRNYCRDSRENAEENANIFQAASEVRYAVVLRQTEYVKPTVTAAEDADTPIQYTDGRISFEGLICDLETPRVLCGFQATAEPSYGKAIISVEKGKSAALRLEKELHFQLVDEARRQIVAALAQVTGG